MCVHAENRPRERDALGSDPQKKADAKSYVVSGRRIEGYSCESTRMSE